MAKIDFEMQVKQALREQGMQSKDLAEKMGITPAYFSDIIRGNRIAKKKKEEIREILKLGKEEN